VRTAAGESLVSEATLSSSVEEGTTFRGIKGDLNGNLRGGGTKEFDILPGCDRS
jgi:hypothetical protein